MKYRGSKSRNPKNGGGFKFSKWLEIGSFIVAIVAFLIIYCRTPDISSNASGDAYVHFYNGNFIFWRYLDLDVLAGKDMYVHIDGTVTNKNTSETFCINTNYYVKDGIGHDFNNLHSFQATPIDGFFQFKGIPLNSRFFEDGNEYKAVTTYIVHYNLLFFSVQKTITDSVIFSFSEKQLLLMKKSGYKENAYKSFVKIPLFH